MIKLKRTKNDLIPTQISTKSDENVNWRLAKIIKYSRLWKTHFDQKIEIVLNLLIEINEDTWKEIEEDVLMQNNPNNCLEIYCKKGILKWNLSN